MICCCLQRDNETKLEHRDDVRNDIERSYTIKKVQEDDSSQVIDFMMKVRKEIFPMLSQDQLPSDLLHFNQH